MFIETMIRNLSNSTRVSSTMVLYQSTIGHSWCKINYFIRSLSSFQPQYNSGLSGKGKSSTKLRASSVLEVHGEVLFGHHPTILALQARKRKDFHCVYAEDKYKTRENRTSAVEHIFQLASEQNIPVQSVTRNVLDHLSGNRPHQGVCMDVGKLQVPEWNNQLSLTRESSVPLWLLLHNVQDPMNFGAILRTAFYLGVDQVVLPSTDSCKLSPVVSKASAGALEMINLVKLSKSTTELEFCKWWQSQSGIVLGTGLEESDRSVLLERFTMTCPTVVILGNEGSGLGQELEAVCDQILTIPSHESTNLTDKVDSLNVSVAAGILLHWIKTSSMNRR